MYRRRHKKKKWLIIPATFITLVLIGGGLVFWHTQDKAPAAVEEGIPHQVVTASGSPTTSSASNHDYVIPPVVNGLVPVISRIPTQESVVFLTIDDGIFQAPTAATLMQTNHIQASFFLVYRFIKSNPQYFAALSRATGSLIEDHTYDHSLQTNLTYTQQLQDICDQARVSTNLFGQAPVLFRPPGGAYNSDTQRAAAACHMKALVMWDATVNNGSLQYQGTKHLKPGDIVLMHFRSTFVEDMNGFIAAEKRAGLHTDLLENWLGQ